MNTETDLERSRATLGMWDSFQMNIAMKTGDSLVSFNAFRFWFFFSVCIRETGRGNRKKREEKRGRGGGSRGDGKW